MLAPKHPKQSERLRALAAYEVVDTAPEKAFDDMVDLVAAICGAPVAMISMVEDQRQWFKAATGTAMNETPIGQSICSYTILGSGVLEIEDTQADPRSAGNPLCAPPKDGSGDAANGAAEDAALRFYAGVPLVTPDGLPIGSLCVLDYRPRRLTDLQRRTLSVVADQVMAQLELRLALRTAETLRREIDHRVKNSLQSLSALARFEARRVSGDEARTSLERLSRRIASVAMVHEQLFRTGTGKTVAADTYLANLARQLQDFAPDGVTVSGMAEPAELISSDASLIGTLFNEAAANAFKHAFPDGRGGSVIYSLTRLADGRLRFTCQDDGVGLRQVSDDRRHGLGSMLGEAISLELDGLLKVDRLDPGLRIRMDFVPKTAKSDG